MAIEDTKQIVRRYQEASNANDLAAWDALVAPDLVSHNATPGLPPGLEGGKMAHRAALAAFPDLHYHVSGQWPVASGRQQRDVVAAGFAPLAPCRGRSTPPSPLRVRRRAWRSAPWGHPKGCRDRGACEGQPAPRLWTVPSISSTEASTGISPTTIAAGNPTRGSTADLSQIGSRGSAGSPRPCTGPESRTSPQPESDARSTPAQLAESRSIPPLRQPPQAPCWRPEGGGPRRSSL